MRLQTRLTLTSAALITGVSLTVGGATTWGAYQHEVDTAHKALVADRAQIASATGQELTTALLLSNQQNLTVALIDSTKAMTVVREGEVALRAKPAAKVLQESSEQPTKRLSADGTPYLLQSVKLANNEWVILQESLADAQQLLNAGWVTLLLFTSIADLIAVLLVALLIRRDLRELRRMVGTARAIAGGTRSTFEVGSGTEVGQLGAALKSMVAQLQANETEMQRFLGDASHELRTPLTVIRGYLEMLGNPARAADGEFAARSIAKMQGEVGRMQRLIDDLLLLTELGSAGRALDVGPVDLAGLVRSEVELMRDLQPGRPVEADLESAIVSGDRHLIDQLLGNLFGNLRRHTGAAVAVQVGLRVEGAGARGAQAVGDSSGAGAGFAVLTIDDAGPGLTTEAYERGAVLFERFNKHRSREGGGSGLGMSIMAGVVARHGGTMALERSPLGGLRTVIKLPLFGGAHD